MNTIDTMMRMHTTQAKTFMNFWDFLWNNI